MMFRVAPGHCFGVCSTCAGFDCKAASTSRRRGLLGTGVTVPSFRLLGGLWDGMQGAGQEQPIGY